MIKWWHSESIYFSAGLCDWVYTDLLFSTDNLSRYKWHMHDHQLTQERPCFSRWELRFGAASLSRALPLQLTARSRVDCAGQTRASTALKLRSTAVNLFSVKSDKVSPHPHFSTSVLSDELVGLIGPEVNACLSHTFSYSCLPAVWTKWWIAN